MQSKSVNDILAAIENADDIEINQILDAVTRRYNRVFPEWEVLFLSISRDPEEKNKQLEQMLLQLKKCDLTSAEANRVGPMV